MDDSYFLVNLRLLLCLSRYLLDGPSFILHGPDRVRSEEGVGRERRGEAKGVSQKKREENR